MTNPNHTDTSRSGDLVASLRALSAWLIANDLDMKLPDEVGDPDDAADRIEALEAKVERWREALQRIAIGDGIGGPDAELQCADIARAALGEKQ